VSKKRDEGLGENPLKDDDALVDALYRDPRSSGSTARRGRGASRRPLPDGRSFRLVTFSFYEEDVARLDELLALAKERGHRGVSRSQIVRLALRQVNLDALPKRI
jgi:hypothetical protein